MKVELMDLKQQFIENERTMHHYHKIMNNLKYWLIQNPHDKAMLWAFKDAKQNYETARENYINIQEYQKQVISKMKIFHINGVI